MPERPHRQTRHTLENIFRNMRAAERKLGIDGLQLMLQSDGSGKVQAWDSRATVGAQTHTEDLDVYIFTGPEQLEAWLHKPRVVQYDDEGKPVEKTAGAGQ